MHTQSKTGGHDVNTGLVEEVRRSPVLKPSSFMYRALVVDDEPVIRQLTMRALAREGFYCDAAHNGKEAREWLATGTYDVVVSDLKMPEECGHTLAMHILQMTNRPAVVNITAVVDPRVERFLRERGVDDILFKPLDYVETAIHIRELGRSTHRSAEHNYRRLGTLSTIRKASNYKQGRCQD